MGGYSVTLAQTSGIWIVDPQTHGGRPVLQKGGQIAFNPGGYPNCIFHEGFPYFTPKPNFNLADGELAPAVSDSCACFWTLDLMRAYLEKFYPEGLPVLVHLAR